MENKNNSRPVSSLRDCQTALDWTRVWYGYQLEFDTAANKKISLAEWPQATFCKGENQPDDVDDNDSLLHLLHWNMCT